MAIIYAPSRASARRKAADIGKHDRATCWYNELESAVYALASYPLRCPVAPEARRMKRGLRNLLHGKKPHVYRVIYEVDERRQAVWVLTIRHGARRKLKPSDLV